MARRSRSSGELAFYHCWTPHPTPLAVLVKVAGRRWRVEEAFQTGKGLCGLDQHQLRRWRCWYRWVTLAMLAHAFPVVAAATGHARHPPPPELVPLSCNEIQHLFAALAARPAGDAAHWWRWSAWRRHQQRARTCHYRRQAAAPGNHEDRLRAIPGWPAGQRARAAHRTATQAHRSGGSCPRSCATG